MSSGYRINRVGDDAAGLAISEKMRAQIRGLKTASKNAQDGVSLVQTSEFALQELHSMLNRMVELATQSANGTYQNETDRENLQKEVSALKDEINRVAESSNFNGIKLLDGSLQTGAANSNLPNVMVNGVTGSTITSSGQDAGNDAVLEVVKGNLSDPSKVEFKLVDSTNIVKFASSSATGTQAFEFNFVDNAGMNQKVELKLVVTSSGAVDSSQSKAFLNGKQLKGNEVTLSSGVLTGTAASSTASTGSDITIVNILNTIKAVKENFGEIKVEKGTGKITVEAKEGNKAVAKSMLANKTNTKPGEMADINAINQSGTTSPKITVHGAKMISFGKTSSTGDLTDINKSIVEVEGIKFAVVNKNAYEGDKSEEIKSKLKAAGVDLKNVILQEKTGNGTSATNDTTAVAKALGDDAVEKLVDRINEVLGEGTVRQEKDATNSSNKTALVFEPKKKAGDSEGLVLQVGDTNDKFQQLTVSIGNMDVRGLGLSDVDISTREAAANSIKDFI